MEHRVSDGCQSIEGGERKVLTEGVLSETQPHLDPANEEYGGCAS